MAVDLTMCTTLSSITLFSTLPTYAPQVQANARRQPVGISPALKTLLYHKVEEELVVTEEGLYRDELLIFKRCLDVGQLYRGVFYFGPLAWDQGVNESNVSIPRWSMDTPSMYQVPTHLWSIESIRALQTTGRILRVPHPYIVTFIKTGGQLSPCLMRSMSQRAKLGLDLRVQEE